MALSIEEKRARDREKSHRWRAANLEHARELDRIKARRLTAAKEGREIAEDELVRLKAALLTEEEKRERRRVKQAKWRAANLDRAREITRLSMQNKAAERALAEGRVPGKPGPAKMLSPEEKRARRKARTQAHTAAHLEEVREKARVREAAKRAGTFVSKALPRLTEEQRRVTEVAWAATRRVRLRENGGKFTRADIERLMVEQHGRCLFCGDPLGDEVPHIDHWMPISRGGSNGPENLALLHQSCNGRKGARLPVEFGLPDDPALVRAALTPESPVPEGDPDGTV